MARRIQPGELRTSRLSTGRCFAYILPCAYEDILKLGFSRDPLDRLQALHRRYFEFFDIDRALLIETESVREARKLELDLGRRIELHSAPAPLVVRVEAAGHTEWYRGAFEILAQAAVELRTAGFVLHQPASPWIRRELLARSDVLFSWSSQTLQAIEWALHTGRPAAESQRLLQDRLDAYAALQIDLEPILPREVLEWHSGR